MAYNDTHVDATPYYATQAAPGATTSMSDISSGAGAGAGVGAGLGTLIGGVLGKEAAQKNFDAANSAYQQALDEANSLNVPELQKLQFIGERQAQLLQNVEAGPSKAESISTDPRLLQAQMEVLQGLKDQGRTGLTAEDRAAFNDLRTRTLRDQQAAQQSMLANAQARGASPGSGVAFALQQAAAQQGAEQQAAGSDRLSAIAAQRAAEARGQYGNLAGNLRNTEFGEKSKIAEAADIAKRFDVANSLGTQKFNIQNEIGQNERNAAAERATQYQNLYAAPMAEYGMQAQKANQLQSALQQYGGHQQAAGQNTAQGYAQMGQGLGQVVGGVAGGAAAFSDEKLKTNIAPANKEIENFLDNLKALKYKYNSPKLDGEGEHYSPMAQDLEKSSVGKAMVEDTPRGKKVNYGKGFGTLTASLANLNQRLRALEKK